MKILREIFLIPVYLYKGILSPFAGPCCRYIPTCSSYMVDAVRKHGVIKGAIMGVMRLLRCSNRYFGGPDPVPETWSWKEIKGEFRVRRKPKDFDKTISTDSH